jgi:hypothetical protein
VGSFGSLARGRGQGRGTAGPGPSASKPCLRFLSHAPLELTVPFCCQAETFCVFHFLLFVIASFVNVSRSVRKKKGRRDKELEMQRNRNR